MNANNGNGPSVSGTDVAGIMECKLDGLRIFGLRRLKINEWPEDELSNLTICRGSTLKLIVATRSRFPVTNMKLRVYSGQFKFNALPIKSVIFPEAATLLPDFVDCEPAVDVAGNTTITFLISGKIPDSVIPGKYELQIFAESDSHGTLCKMVSLNIISSPDVISKWECNTIFWPQWQALCQYYKIEMWSEEFWELADKYLGEMAAGGNNSIMLSIKDDPFRYPLPKLYYHHHDKPCPIRWQRNGDSWSFDYTLYDRYIELNLKHGINREIECYSLLPCKRQLPDIAYYDLRTGEYIIQPTTYDSPEYESAWGAFITDFMRHNKSRGWDHLLTLCPYDEPTDPATFRAVALMAKKYAPEIKISAAITATTAVTVCDVINIATIHLSDGFSQDACKFLRSRGVELRWYNCCKPDWGNTLFCCGLADSYRIPWITYANQFSGYLRWSIFNFTKDVFSNPGFNWPTGDMYLLYPGISGPLSSLRWEAYKAGLHDLKLALSFLDSSSSRQQNKLIELIARLGRAESIDLPEDISFWQNELYSCMTK